MMVAFCHNSRIIGIILCNKNTRHLSSFYFYFLSKCKNGNAIFNLETLPSHQAGKGYKKKKKATQHKNFMKHNNESMNREGLALS